MPQATPPKLVRYQLRPTSWFTATKFAIRNPLDEVEWRITAGFRWGINTWQMRDRDDIPRFSIQQSRWGFQTDIEIYERSDCVVVLRYTLFAIRGNALVAKTADGPIEIRGGLLKRHFSFWYQDQPIAKMIRPLLAFDSSFDVELVAGAEHDFLLAIAVAVAVTS